jgi:hypothetical protein
MATLQASDALSAALRWLRLFLAGPGPALATQPRLIPSRAGNVAVTRSVVLGSKLDTSSQEPPYDLEGMQVAYTIDGAGLVTRDVGGTGAAVLAATGPNNAQSRAFSFHEKRLGIEAVAPAFDLIAAGGDRVIAKALGDDRIFVGVVDDPYVHFAGGTRLRLPQCLFKLDPELAASGASVGDLLASVGPFADDDERHPATERFPLFRCLFGSDALRGFAQRSGLFEQMNMRFVPEAWHELDLRPLRATANPPEGFRSYDHARYECGDPAEPILVKKSVRYEEVLDLGVGVTHLHEQHDNRFGGELDNLGLIPIGALRELTGVMLTSDEAYQLANGPIQDYGGWVDGTCIYYMLVRLKPFIEDDFAAQENAFAVLWTDEQTGFTERWRLLDLADHKFGSPFKPIIGLVTDSEKRENYYPDAPFDAATFWSPLADGNITPESRMAVSRQIVVLTGRDPDEWQPEELYTIHFGWPTMDRSWRWRKFPRGGDGLSRWQYEGVDPDTLRIRDDTTIALAGRATLGTKTINGWWCQRYLPADGQEQPAAQDLNSGKPGLGYDHPWRFVSTRVFEAADRRFSHFGAYEPATAARHQAYRVTVHNRSSDAGTNDVIARTVWIDSAQTLKITHERLNWTTLADALSGRGGQPNDAIENRTRPSIYNSRQRFAMQECRRLQDEDDENTGALDVFLLTHYDVRDDKLIAFDGVGSPAVGAPATVRLTRWTEGQNPTDTPWIDISFDAHLRNDVRMLHGATVAQEIDAVSPPQVREATVTTVENGGEVEVTVRFTFARDMWAAAHASFQSYRDWSSVNVSRVRLGALFHTNGNRRDIPVLHEWQHDWTVNNQGLAITGVWRREPGDPPAAELLALLSENGAAEYGTSLWFVGATGLLAPADNVEWR